MLFYDQIEKDEQGAGEKDHRFSDGVAAFGMHEDAFKIAAPSGDGGQKQGKSEGGFSEFGQFGFQADKFQEPHVNEWRKAKDQDGGR